MDVNIRGWDCLMTDRWSITEEGDVRERNCQVFLRNVEVRQSGEHHGIVVLLLTKLILQSDDLEALATN